MSTLFLLLLACGESGQPAAASLFERGVVEGIELEEPTAMVWGPDDRLYVAELAGRIVALTLDSGGRAVVDVEELAAPDDFNQILGLAFNSQEEEPGLYVSNNFVLGTSEGNPFPNEVVRLGGPDWSERRVVISGLPVSKHNHGTNALAFDDSGRLFIAQGGATPLGVPSTPDDDRWGDWDETPLSAALLVADLSDPDFDGALVYDRPEATAETNLVSGDVAVFAAGLRNMYDFVLHSNGNIYGIDNGSSEPVPASADCQAPAAPPDNDPDQVHLLLEGEYYGSPNRNRGREDARQCAYVPPSDETPEEHDMLRLVPPSSNAIIEFRGDFFQGSWQGDLIYAWWSGGEIRRLPLSDDGTAVEGEETIGDGFSFPLAMVQAPNGTIYIAEFGGGVISYLAPQE